MMEQKRGNHLHESKEILSHNEKKVRLMYKQSIKMEKETGV